MRLSVDTLIQSDRLNLESVCRCRLCARLTVIVFELQCTAVDEPPEKFSVKKQLNISL